MTTMEHKCTTDINKYEVIFQNGAWYLCAMYNLYLFIEYCPYCGRKLGLPGVKLGTPDVKVEVSREMLDTWDALLCRAQGAISYGGGRNATMASGDVGSVKLQIEALLDDLEGGDDGAQMQGIGWDCNRLGWQ